LLNQSPRLARRAGPADQRSRRFGFDAVFPTCQIWVNDPDHAVFDGYRALAARLHTAIPDLLLAGEYDYDALLGCFGLFQRAWWTQSPAFTQRYVRRFAHLCEGEPEGRTGVHEFGVDRRDRRRAGSCWRRSLQDRSSRRDRSGDRAGGAARRVSGCRGRRRGRGT
jgi:hypothetical protein